jgi:MOZ/SAS family/MYST family zinc finger domain/RNA binding activity-knot of a chromodomain
MANKRQNGNQFGAGGGKGKGKLIDDVEEISFREPLDSDKFPGAIKKDRYVQAVMRDNKTWCVSKIIDIRVKQQEDDSG